MRGEETEQRGRFRARLLRVNEPVPVFYFDNIKIKRDSKELYQWLLSSEGQAQGQVQVVDVDGRPVISKPWSRTHKQEDQTIKVPGWRYMSSDESASSASDCTESTKAGSTTDALIYEPPYQRWIQQSADGFEQRQEYLLDDDDIDWLEEKGICEEHFESIVDVLEKQHYEQLLDNRSMFQTKLSSGRIGLQMPDIAKVLPLAKAQELVGSYEKKEVEFIYNYWQEKRNEVGKPLLERICDQFPWNVILDHHRTIEPLAMGGHVDGPFAAVTIPEKSKRAPYLAKQRQLTLDEERRRMHAIRHDMEEARNLADQVRKRERMKQALHDAQLDLIRLQMEGYMAVLPPEPAEERNGGAEAGQDCSEGLSNRRTTRSQHSVLMACTTPADTPTDPPSKIRKVQGPLKHNSTQTRNQSNCRGSNAQTNSKGDAGKERVRLAMRKGREETKENSSGGGKQSRPKRKTYENKSERSSKSTSDPPDPSKKRRALAARRILRSAGPDVVCSKTRGAAAIAKLQGL